MFNSAGSSLLEPSRPPFSRYLSEYENNVSFFIGFSISDTSKVGKFLTPIKRSIEFSRYFSITAPCEYNSEFFTNFLAVPISFITSTPIDDPPNLGLSI